MGQIPIHVLQRSMQSNFSYLYYGKNKGLCFVMRPWEGTVVVLNEREAKWNN
jgi:hypothetical protein